jgi:hypothetical protein
LLDVFTSDYIDYMFDNTSGVGKDLGMEEAHISFETSIGVFRIGWRKSWPIGYDTFTRVVLGMSNACLYS